MQIKGLLSMEATLSKCIEQLDAELATNKMGKPPYKGTDRILTNAKKSIQMALWNLQGAKIDYTYANKRKKFSLTNGKDVL